MDVSRFAVAYVLLCVPRTVKSVRSKGRRSRREKSNKRSGLFTVSARAKRTEIDARARESEKDGLIGKSSAISPDRRQMEHISI